VPSTFAWLDTSEADRRRVLDVIDLLSKSGTVDELGIGGVRDAIADRLAPATSTIQTRVRYLFFIPWMYRHLERKGGTADKIAQRARQFEISLTEVLSRSPDSAGTIGILAGGSIKRLPSSVYWAGLGSLGIRLFRGSIENYHRAISLAAARLAEGRTVVEPHPDDGREEAAPRGHWHPHLPDAPSGFPEAATFRLTREEADYLSDRFRTYAPGSLVSFLVDSGRAFERTDFPWQHPLLGSAPARAREDVDHARCFSEALHGAALLYNLMLAQELGNSQWTDEYQAELAKWAAMAEDRRDVLRAWDRAAFWQLVEQVNPRVSPRTRGFCDTWIDRVLASPAIARLAEDVVARQLVSEREHRMKGARSRLHHREYLELWGGESFAGQLDYRWTTTQTFALDIAKGYEPC